MSLIFNNLLYKFCTENSLTFLDTTEEFMDPLTNILKIDFTGTDNHYKGVGSIAGSTTDSPTQKIFVGKLLEICNLLD